MITAKKTNARHGSVLIGTVFGLIFILGMLALVTDMAWLYYQKIRIEGVVSAAWRAGMDEIIIQKNTNSTIDETKVKDRVRNIFQINGYAASELSEPFVDPGGRRLTVYGKTPQPLFFSRIFGMDSRPVDGLRDGTGGEGMIPLCLVPGDIQYGIKYEISSKTGALVPVEGYWYNDFSDIDFDNDQGYIASQEYILKLGPENQKLASPTVVATGYDELINWGGNSNEGSLDLGGQGASNWLENMLYGYAGSLAVGDYVNTAQGEVSSKTEIGREARAKLGDMVTVPIIKVVGDDTVLYNTGGSKTLVIVGFARMVISAVDEKVVRTELGEYTDTQIRGRFVDYLVRPTKETLGLNF